MSPAAGVILDELVGAVEFAQQIPGPVEANLEKLTAFAVVDTSAFAHKVEDPLFFG